MEVLPVLDIKDGAAVQGYRGERERYRPVESVLTDSSDPLDLLRALLAATGASTWYAADLDALQGKGDNASLLDQLAVAAGVPPWIDAGTGTLEAVEALLEQVPAAAAIVGSETLNGEEGFHSLSVTLPERQRIFSLDIKDRRPLTGEGSPFAERTIMESLELLSSTGWRRVILLGLEQVGTGGGLPFELLGSARRAFPELELYAGGGLRSAGELGHLASLGVSGVLAATALHRGWITSTDIEEVSP
ncbi:MAG: phosphoribosylformimino-5-aminoimidazole carboxamide ribotide isomerase [Synergistales bacterium]|nr:phosphoribosylformimino-5-aminoimidazole carboxamide ribotide isomerase [Synergistales bacterium]